MEGLQLPTYRPPEVRKMEEALAFLSSHPPISASTSRGLKLNCSPLIREPGKCGFQVQSRGEGGDVSQQEQALV